MKILLVEPWLTGSHKAWAEGYAANSSHEVGIVGLPGELWRWRLRGGAVPLANQITTWIDINGQPDLLLVSGLVDVAELLGLARRNLSPHAAVVIYQHESQLVYPVADGNYDTGAALRNWVSWCVADLVLFNSYHHMRSVTDALPGFIAAQPDDTHQAMIEPVTGRFEVFPVGVDLSAVPEQTPVPTLGQLNHPSSNDFDANTNERGDDDSEAVASSTAPENGNVASAGEVQPDVAKSVIENSGERPVILWPHRWERDKDPAAFLAALRKLREENLDFGLVLAGQDPPSGSAISAGERAAVESEFADNIVASGEFDREQYLRYLSECDLVVSCARHEFFGVAIVEAVASGCVPLLPNALSYPELIRPPWHSAVLYEPGTFGTRLVDAVQRIDDLRAETIGLSSSLHRYSWGEMAPVYDERLEAVVTRLQSAAVTSGPDLSEPTSMAPDQPGSIQADTDQSGSAKADGASSPDARSDGASSPDARSDGQAETDADRPAPDESKEQQPEKRRWRQTFLGV